MVYEIFQDCSHVRIVMECCTGGSLYNWVKASHGLAEAQMMKLLWQMLAGIGYLHHHGFAHRDIKPSNYLFTTVSSDAVLKLIDMGFACPFKRGVPMTARVGTVECTAPEVARGSYDEKCDVWSVGIVTFFCMVAYCPFQAGPAEEVLRKVLRDQVVFKIDDWALVSREMIAIVKKMLTKLA